MKESKQMTPNEYQQLALRTRCPQPTALAQLVTAPDMVPLLHSVIGLTGEAGELASAIQKWMYYGKPLDETNVVEEFGDALWYIAEGLEAIGWNMEDVMKLNIQKLQKRYPEKFTEELAAEENRNLKAEREVLEQREQTGSGFAELPEEKETVVLGQPVEQPEYLMNGWEVARRTAINYCSGQNLDRALKYINQQEVYYKECQQRFTEELARERRQKGR